MRMKVFLSTVHLDVLNDVDVIAPSFKNPTNKHRIKRGSSQNETQSSHGTFQTSTSIMQMILGI